MYANAIKMIQNADNVIVIQGENPDGDSLGSSIALEDILATLNKKVTMFCAIDMPKYLHYVSGWDRVTNQFDYGADLAIIVDTSAETLLEKTLQTPAVRHFLESHPVLVLDHHGEENDEESQNTLSFKHEFVLDPKASATCELIYNISKTAKWQLSPISATAMFISIASDTLGLTNESAGSATYQVVADLVKLGANPYLIESARREYMKKPADILNYKGDLIKRIQYSLNGALATVHIPWEDIAEYSDRYNPSVLVLDEMRLVDTVQIACAIKTYPDGKLTGKLRCNIPVASTIAGYFGGGGHNYAAGFKVHENYDVIMRELTESAEKALKDYYDNKTI